MFNSKQEQHLIEIRTYKDLLNRVTVQGKDCLVLIALQHYLLNVENQLKHQLDELASIEEDRRSLNE